MDDILNIAQSAMRVTEPLPGKIPLLFQLLDRTADRIHPIFTDMGQPLSRISGLAMENGHIQVDRAQRTNLPGCFAAGDCTGRPYQYAKAAGEGNVAVHSALAFLAQPQEEPR